MDSHLILLPGHLSAHRSKDALLFCAPAACETWCWFMEPELSPQPSSDGDPADPVGQGDGGWGHLWSTQWCLGRLVRVGGDVEFVPLPTPSERVVCRLRGAWAAGQDAAWAEQFLGLDGTQQLQTGARSRPWLRPRVTPRTPRYWSENHGGCPQATQGSSRAAGPGARCRVVRARQ